MNRNFTPSVLHARFLFGVSILLLSASVNAQQPAFPGAAGAAWDVTGGRGGIVYHVTELDRNFNHGILLPTNQTEGTLRYGLDDNNFTGALAGVPRTIVFDVAGTFWLGRYGEEQGHFNGWDSQSRLNIGSNVTIAGQTAPGPVSIMGGVVKANNNNAIVRNVTIAPGYGMRGFEQPDGDPNDPDVNEHPKPPDPGNPNVPGDPRNFPDSYVFDALDISAQGVMIDHVSTIYATDETISANEDADDITIQYSNISQGENYPQADAEGNGSVRYTGHALGSLLQAGSNAEISVVNNLYAHQKGRLPRVGSEVGSGAFNDFRNNVFYNWFGTAGGDASGQPSFNNFIHNFYLAGPGGDDVSQTAGFDGINNNADDFGIVVQRNGGTQVFGASSAGVYDVGNLRDINKDGDPNDGSAVSITSSASNPSAAYDIPAGVTLTANDAFDNVLRYMGANWWQRDYDVALGNTGAIDTVDERIIHETYTGTGKIVAWADDPFNDFSDPNLGYDPYDPNEGAEWRQLLSFRADPNSGAAPFNHGGSWDTDRDGMPNFWEKQHGLDPNVANNNADFDTDGYTDLEEYLNDVAAWPAPHAIHWNGTNSRYAEIGNWDVTGETVVVQGAGAVVTSSNWQPSRYDEVQINTGTVTVDAPGQHANDLTIASQAGDTAQLAITDGWLKASSEVVIGGTPTSSGFLFLAGGRLFTPLLSKGTSGTFSFSGGALTAETVDFDLVNSGGTIAPATLAAFDVGNEVVTVESEIGTTHVVGDLEMQSGTIEFQLAGDLTGEFDRVIIDNLLTAGGTLSVSLLDSFVPEDGDTFDLLDFGSVGGSFVFDLPALSDGLQWDTSSMLVDGVLSVEFLGDADFNGDTRVDGLDFLILQQGLGLTGQVDNSNGDADGNGVVDQADLAIWDSLYGTSSSPISATSSAVPEPATLFLALAGLLGMLRFSRVGNYPE